MMLFGIRRLAAAQASARMLPRSLRTHATQSEKRGRPHGWRGSTELQRTDASTTHLAERLLLGRQLLLWLGLHLRGVLHEHGLVHQILYEGAARGRQLLCGTREAPSVGPPGLVLYEGECRQQYCSPPNNPIAWLRCLGQASWRDQLSAAAGRRPPALPLRRAHRCAAPDFHATSCSYAPSERWVGQRGRGTPVPSRQPASSRSPWMRRW